MLTCRSGLVASISRFTAFLSWTPISSNTVKIGIATIVEVSFYLIAACLLSMRPLIAKFLGRAEVVSSKYFWPKKKEARWDLMDDGDERPFMPEKEKWDALDDSASKRQLMLERGDGARDGRLQTVVVGVVEEDHGVRKPQKVKIKITSKFHWRR